MVSLILSFNCQNACFSSFIPTTSRLTKFNIVDILLDNLWMRLNYISHDHFPSNLKHFIACKIHSYIHVIYKLNI